MNKVKILTFSVYYLPGYKGGGPVRTIENMVSHLDQELEFWIVTRDRDLGDSTPYPAIQRGIWQKVGSAYVYYLPAEDANFAAVGDLIKSTPHDIVYLNSFFDPVFTIYPLLHRLFGKAKRKPFVLAPRGEFAVAALTLKKFKKTCYLIASRLLRLTKNVLFQASSEYEQDDIQRALGVNITSIKIAPDLPSHIHASSDLSAPELTDGAPLRVIFLSRISPMKNLDFAIRALMFVKFELQFDIYGPKEDEAYWSYCEQLLGQLPENVKFNYCGKVLPEDVKNTFSRYDLFLFPTRGENYGHVIAESISMGTPVLLSDRTPWRALEENDLGWVLPLDAPESFAEKMNLLSNSSVQHRQEKRRHILEYAKANLCDPESVNKNRELFLALAGNRGR
ncbi:glycosyltransferase family 4 protein [Pseudomonas fluorescens]|uniref:glycosyltransferase family 4 protein n=1 Tax=Pseudomonas fluorescens TaxID=294 RepID=UPI0004CFDE10|nr:glycosyltransferase family 4 protein [Pseudomonas fluorescens]